ncbi:MAG: hypothetical protein PCFJNLEI_01055 [Verrucomicrobiae bacterium]|nr:hypothetical protein [Verrucomicrobiae bacterium]
MGREAIAGLFNVNRSVTNVGGEARQMRLPTMSPFPKLDQRVLRRPVQTGGSVMLSSESGALPEMTSDILGVDAGYAVENVKRDRLGARPAPKVGLAHLVGRMLGQAQPVVRL